MSLKDKLPGAIKRDAKKTEKEKIEERREEVLSRGRRFKYPMQYSKHWLVFITIALAFLALAGSVTYSYFALYKTKQVNDVIYRLTTIIPAPVANIDGKNVRYSDYLMLYRSSITPIEQQNGAIGDDENAESLKNYYRRTALDMAEEYTYAIKLANELDIKVTDEMVDQALLAHRKVSGTERSEESFTKVLKDNFDLTIQEYRRILYLSLIKVEVSKSIDKDAENKAIEVETTLKKHENDFQKVAEELKLEYEDTGGLVSIMNVDGGRSAAAYELEPGQVSGKIVSSGGDCFYYIKLLEKSKEQVKYASIKIPFTEFDKRIEELKNSNKIKEYIDIQVEEKEIEKPAEEAPAEQ